MGEPYTVVKRTNFGSMTDRASLRSSVRRMGENGSQICMA